MWKYGSRTSYTHLILRNLLKVLYNYSLPGRNIIMAGTRMSDFGSVTATSENKGPYDIQLANNDASVFPRTTPEIIQQLLSTFLKVDGVTPTVLSDISYNFQGRPRRFFGFLKSVYAECVTNNKRTKDDILKAASKASIGRIIAYNKERLNRAFNSLGKAKRIICKSLFINLLVVYVLTAVSIISFEYSTACT